MSNETKEIVQSATVRNIPFWICLVVSIGLMVTGFFMPPKAVIDGSVLTGAGELLGYAGVWCVFHAINKGTDAKIKHGQTEVTIGDLNNDN